MEFSTINQEGRLAILEQLIAQYENQIYRNCIALSINPDTFDAATYTYEIPVMRHEEVLLKDSIDSLNNAKQELSKLQNQ